MQALIIQEPPNPSYVGIAIAGLSLIVMPLIAREKRKVANRLRSSAMIADSRRTDICAYLSVILIGGLGLNAVFGFLWAGPIAALIMVPIIVKEGTDAVRGKTCCGDGACR